MRALIAVLMLVVTTACGGRQVNVRTGPGDASGASLHVTNNTSQAVNVSIVSGGQDIFQKQVPANGAEHIAVQGVPAGAVVTLKATKVDGTSTYTKENVSLSGTYMWQVP